MGLFWAHLATWVLMFSANFNRQVQTNKANHGYKMRRVTSIAANATISQ